MLDVSKGGRHVATLIPSRGYYPSLDQATFGRIGRFFNGESTSELGLRASLTRDIWTAVQPDLSAVEPMIKDADRRFPDANAQLEGFLVSTVVRRYMQAAPVADFRLIVSPLVAWIWIGGVIVAGGAWSRCGPHRDGNAGAWQRRRPPDGATWTPAPPVRWARYWPPRRPTLQPEQARRVSRRSTPRRSQSTLFIAPSARAVGG